MEEEIKYRICNSCREEKKLVENFYFVSMRGNYMGTCKECKNKARRKKHNEITESRDENFYYIKQQECIKCGKAKKLEEFIKLGGIKTKVCNSCLDEFNTSNYKNRLNKGNLSDDCVKICFKCKEEKNITEFSYLKSREVYSSYCKTCDQLKGKLYRLGLSEEQLERKRKRNLDYRIKDNSKHLFSSYNKFDFVKGLESNLTLDFIKQTLNQSCIYCSYPATGLDRLDNSKGHTIENCVPCCRECNTTRMNNYTHEEMLVLGKVIKQIKNNRL